LKTAEATSTICCQAEAADGPEEEPTMGDVDEQPLLDDALPAGTRVEVRNRFDSRWSRGFEVAGVDEQGYRLRRLTDGSELPTRFGHDAVRPERRRANDMWWY
jgi:hypothetical protein